MNNMILSITLNLGLSILANRASTPSGYTVLDLGMLLASDKSFGNSINGKKKVTGYSNVHDGNNHAFLFGNGKMTDLGTLPGGKYSFGHSISEENKHGSVFITEYADTESGYNHAFLYADGTIQDLGTLPGGNYSGGTGTNQSGQVAGTSEISSYRNQHAFLYSDGKMFDLGTLPGGSFSQGQCINRSGEVAGTSGSTHGSTRLSLP
ncbi:MAG: hypothetical protein JWQ42_4237 [Edaphobacter sp.]|nr:hypothetical protein [Edaphobacter sp.]